MAAGHSRFFLRARAASLTPPLCTRRQLDGSRPPRVHALATVAAERPPRAPHSLVASAIAASTATSARSAATSQPAAVVHPPGAHVVSGHLPLGGGLRPSPARLSRSPQAPPRPSYRSPAARRTSARPPPACGRSRPRDAARWQRRVAAAAAMTPQRPIVSPEPHAPPPARPVSRAVSVASIHVPEPARGRRSRSEPRSVSTAPMAVLTACRTGAANAAMVSMTAPGKPTMAVTMMRVRDAAETPHTVRALGPIMRRVSERHCLLTGRGT